MERLDGTIAPGNRARMGRIAPLAGLSVARCVMGFARVVGNPLAASAAPGFDYRPFLTLCVRDWEKQGQ